MKLSILPVAAAAVLGAETAAAQVTATYVPLAAPCRMVDTRVDESGGPLLAATPRNFLTTGAAYPGVTVNPCTTPAGVPATATGIVVNFTLTQVSGPTNLRVAPWGTSPTNSILNAASGTLANATVAAIATDGAGQKGISVQSCCASAHFIVDLFGYFTTQGGYTDLTPAVPNVVHGHGGNTISVGVAGGTISGGGGVSVLANAVTDAFSTVSGGRGNRAGDADGDTSDAPGATVCGGESNVASDGYATVGGGSTNWASGVCSTVPGGCQNSAASYSFAAGDRAKAIHTGSFVFSDGSGTDFSSGAPNTFSVRASGGAIFYSNSDANAGVSLAAGGGAWATVSERGAKRNFEQVDSKAIVAKLVALPLETWSYKAQDPAIRHIGPMAEDFHAAFGVGEDQRHITTGDADGVALAAIQGLHQMVVELQARVAELEARGAR